MYFELLKHFYYSVERNFSQNKLSVNLKMQQNCFYKFTHMYAVNRANN